MKFKPLAALCATLFLAPAFAADLHVTVANVASADGKVLVGLFDGAAGFPRQVARGEIVGAAQRDAQGRLRVVFSGLPPGSYAVSAVHDRDGDGRLNRNLMGVPSEPYGFSGRGAGRFGPPEFTEAAVVVPESGLDITIGLQ